MKAVVYKKFGPPKVLSIQENEKPDSKNFEDLLKKDIYLTTFPTLISFIHKIAGSSESKTVRFAAPGLRKAYKKKKDLYLIKELVEQGIIKPVIDRVYSMEQIADAHAYVEEGHKKGDVVINCQKKIKQ